MYFVQEKRLIMKRLMVKCGSAGPLMPPTSICFIRSLRSILLLPFNLYGACFDHSSTLTTISTSSPDVSTTTALLATWFDSATSIQGRFVRKTLQLATSILMRIMFRNTRVLSILSQGNITNKFNYTWYAVNVKTKASGICGSAQSSCALLHRWHQYVFGQEC